MNYYPRYPGDYLAKTLHLSMVEDGAYTRLLDWYYSNEQPIPHARRYAVARATSAAERAAVDTVLAEFFSAGAEVHRHSRVDAEIAEAAPRIAAAKANGSKGGRKPKKNPAGNPAGSDPLTQQPSSPTPTLTSPSESSEPNGSGGKPPADMGKDELWKAGKSLLAQDGLPEAQCGSFVGGLVKQYGEAAVIDAVRSTVLHGAAGAREYLKATCMRLAGERKDPPKPITVPSDDADKTDAYLAERKRQDEMSKSPEAEAARLKAMAAVRRAA